MGDKQAIEWVFVVPSEVGDEKCGFLVERESRDLVEDAISRDVNFWRLGEWELTDAVFYRDFISGNGTEENQVVGILNRSSAGSSGFLSFVRRKSISQVSKSSFMNATLTQKWRESNRLPIFFQ